MKQIYKKKLRFAPSPTGNMHFGNARTALFNWLIAKHYQGIFLLRIEDTDQQRSEEIYTHQIFEDLRWLGLKWDEGPESGGSYGPYLQSQRQTVYDQYYQQLEKMNLVYPCFCSEAELKMERQLQLAQGKPPRYSGTCRALTDVDIKARLQAGEKPTLRFRVPIHDVVKFHDLVRGSQRFATDDIGDFIIRRADGTPPFMFCNAIDDATMGVTTVIRGEDHLTNTPRQILILNALQLTAPEYGHIALIVGQDGSPLSKRHGSRSLKELRAMGYLAEAINNYLARLGHYYGHDEFLTLNKLAEQFKIEALVKSPAKFNPEQLLFWQKAAIDHLDQEQFYEWLGDELREKIPQEKQSLFFEIIRPNVIFPDDAKQWIGILFSPLELTADQRTMLSEAHPDYFTLALEAYHEFGPDFQSIIKYIQKKLGIKGQTLYQPLRIALTGQHHGPELAKMMQIISTEMIEKRLKQFR